MITVEKAIKDNKVKNATESSEKPKSNLKNKLLWGAGIVAAIYIGYKLFYKKSEKVYTPNT